MSDGPPPVHSRDTALRVSFNVRYFNMSGNETASGAPMLLTWNTNAGPRSHRFVDVNSRGGGTMPLNLGSLHEPVDADASIGFQFFTMQRNAQNIAHQTYAGEAMVYFSDIHKTLREGVRKVEVPLYMMEAVDESGAPLKKAALDLNFSIEHADTLVERMRFKEADEFSVVPENMDAHRRIIGTAAMQSLGVFLPAARKKYGDDFMQPIEESLQGFHAPFFDNDTAQVPGYAFAFDRPSIRYSNNRIRMLASMALDQFGRSEKWFVRTVRAQKAKAMQGKPEALDADFVDALRVYNHVLTLQSTAYPYKGDSIEVDDGAGGTSVVGIENFNDSLKVGWGDCEDGGRLAMWFGQQLAQRQGESDARPGNGRMAIVSALQDVAGLYAHMMMLGSVTSAAIIDGDGDGEGDGDAKEEQAQIAGLWSSFKKKTKKVRDTVKTATKKATTATKGVPNTVSRRDLIKEIVVSLRLYADLYRRVFDESLVFVNKNHHLDIRRLVDVLSEMRMNLDRVVSKSAKQSIFFATSKPETTKKAEVRNVRSNLDVAYRRWADGHSKHMQTMPDNMDQWMFHYDPDVKMDEQKLVKMVRDLDSTLMEETLRAVANEAKRRMSDLTDMVNPKVAVKPAGILRTDASASDIEAALLKAYGLAESTPNDPPASPTESETDLFAESKSSDSFVLADDSIDDEDDDTYYTAATNVDVDDDANDSALEEMGPIDRDDKTESDMLESAEQTVQVVEKENVHNSVVPMPSRNGPPPPPLPPRSSNAQKETSRPTLPFRADDLAKGKESLQKGNIVPEQPASTQGESSLADALRREAGKRRAALYRDDEESRGDESSAADWETKFSANGTFIDLTEEGSEEEIPDSPPDSDRNGSKDNRDALSTGADRASGSSRGSASGGSSSIVADTFLAERTDQNQNESDIPDKDSANNGSLSPQRLPEENQNTKNETSDEELVSVPRSTSQASMEQPGDEQRPFDSIDNPEKVGSMDSKPPSTVGASEVVEGLSDIDNDETRQQSSVRIRGMKVIRGDDRRDLDPRDPGRHIGKRIDYVLLHYDQRSNLRAPAIARPETPFEVFVDKTDFFRVLADYVDKLQTSFVDFLQRDDIFEVDMRAARATLILRPLVNLELKIRKEALERERIAAAPEGGGVELIEDIRQLQAAEFMMRETFTLIAALPIDYYTAAYQTRSRSRYMISFSKQRFDYYARRPVKYMVRRVSEEQYFNLMQDERPASEDPSTVLGPRPRDFPLPDDEDTSKRRRLKTLFRMHIGDSEEQHAAPTITIGSEQDLAGPRGGHMWGEMHSWQKVYDMVVRAVPEDQREQYSPLVDRLQPWQRNLQHLLPSMVAEGTGRLDPLIRPIASYYADASEGQARDRDMRAEIAAMQTVFAASPAASQMFGYRRYASARKDAPNSRVTSFYRCAVHAFSWQMLAAGAPSGMVTWLEKSRRVPDAEDAPYGSSAWKKAAKRASAEKQPWRFGSQMRDRVFSASGKKTVEKVMPWQAMLPAPPVDEVSSRVIARSLARMPPLGIYPHRPEMEKTLRDEAHGVALGLQSSSGALVDVGDGTWAELVDRPFGQGESVAVRFSLHPGLLRGAIDKCTPEAFGRRIGSDLKSLVENGSIRRMRVIPEPVVPGHIESLRVEMEMTRSV